MVNKTEQFEEYFYPMLVSSHPGIQDPDEAILRRWDRFDTLPEQFRDILVSQETAGVIKYISNQYQFSQDKIEEITRIIRSLFFGEISQENLANEIQKRIPTVGSDNVHNIARIIVEKIVNATPKGRIDTSVELTNLPLPQALQKYPRLGEQLVTGSPIRLKIFPEPVRPSIKNWIADYHQVLGAGAHGTMERGNFLYHSENGKRLSFGERQKLAVILKSLDENEAVSVDVDKQEIVFAQTPLTRPDEHRGTLSPNRARGDELGTPHLETLSSPRPRLVEAGQRERGMLGRPPLLSGEDARRAGEGDDFHFSSPQRLQSEPPQPKSYQHFDPYHIDPVGYPEDRPKPEPPKPPVPPSASRTEPRIEGNVVDLRT